MCFVDADQDGVTDIIDHGNELMAVHGTSGSIIWTRGGEQFARAQLYCDPRGGLLIYRDEAFVITGLDPRSGRELWNAKLHDKLGGLGFGPGCVVARAADGSTARLDLRTGAATACENDVVMQSTRPARAKVSRAGDLEVTLASTTGPGTARVLLRATRNGSTLWQTQIPEIVFESSSSRGSVVAATASAVYVTGKKHGGPGMFVAVLDARSGAITAKRDEAHVAKNDAFFMEIDTTPAAVYVQSFGMIHAYHPRTLAPLWWAGAMWAG